MNEVTVGRIQKERDLINLFRRAPALANGEYPERRGPLVDDFEQAYTCASAQLVASGENAVGENRTPVVSFWPMKDKWKKLGSWFTCIGSDGNSKMVHIREGSSVKTLKEPMMLQLYYKVLGDGSVMQLAWARPDWRIMDDRIIRSEQTTITM